MRALAVMSRVAVTNIGNLFLQEPITAFLVSVARWCPLETVYRRNSKSPQTDKKLPFLCQNQDFPVAAHFNNGTNRWEDMTLVKLVRHREKQINSECVDFPSHSTLKVSTKLLTSPYKM